MSAQVGFPVQFFSELYANVLNIKILLPSVFFAVFDAVEYDDRHWVYLSFIISCGCIFQFYFTKLAPRKEGRKKKIVQKREQRKNSIKFENKLIGFRFYIHSWNLVQKKVACEEIKKSGWILNLTDLSVDTNGCSYYKLW